MRKIILSEEDYDVLVLKLDYVDAILDLLVSDNGNSNWADNTILNSLGAISTMTYEMSQIVRKAEVAA